MVEQILIAIGWFVSGFILGIIFTKFCRFMSRKLRQQSLFDYPDTSLFDSSCSDRDNSNPDLDDSDINDFSRDPICLEREREDRF